MNLQLKGSMDADNDGEVSEEEWKRVMLTHVAVTIRTYACVYIWVYWRAWCLSV